MDREAFTRPSGQLVETDGGAWAFIPDPLPLTQLDMSRLAEPVADALHALGELEGAARRLTNLFLLIQPLRRLEAISSSAMEGTWTTMDALVMAEADLGKPREDDIEVANFVKALRYAEENIEQGRTLNLVLIREVHRILLSNVGARRGENKYPGEFKKAQNMIGGREPSTARYVPTPPLHTPAAMEELGRFINGGKRETYFRKIIDLALIHYQFEAIHPFADGNGRVGRMLIPLLARSWALTEHARLYVSPEIEQNKDEYIDRLFAVSAESAWEDWIIFFASMVSKACRSSIDKIDALMDLHDTYRQEVERLGRSINFQRVIDMIFVNPIITAPRLQSELDITPVAAHRIIQALSKVRILERLENQGRLHVWRASRILEITSS